MSIIYEINSKFGTSTPIFKVELSEGNNDIKIGLVDKYNPFEMTINNPDPVVKVAAKHYMEDFNKTLREFRRMNFENDIFSSIMLDIITIYNKHSGLKNPNQSNMHKWLYESTGKYNYPFSDGFVMLYRYAVNNKVDLIPSYNGKDSVHVRNFLAILNRMKDVYGKRS